MSKTYSKFTNKHPKHPKDYFQQYLYNVNEPPEHLKTSAWSDFDEELQEDTEILKQNFRYRAHSLRNQ